MNSSKKILKAADVKFVKRSAACSHSFEKAGFGRMDRPQDPPSEMEKALAAAADKLRRTEKASYDRGFREGVAFQKEETAPVAEELARLVREIGGLKQRIFSASEKEMLRLVLAVAEKVIHREASLQADVILHVLRNAMRSVVDREGMKIRLNPRDFRHIMEVKQDFLQSIDGVRNVLFEEDAGIGPGGAMIETSFGEVDARLEQQIEEIRNALEERLG